MQLSFLKNMVTKSNPYNKPKKEKKRQPVEREKKKLAKALAM